MATLVSNRVTDLFRQETRTSGYHVSSALHSVMRSLHPDRFGGGPINDVRATLGNAMESAIARALHDSDPDRYVTLGQLECPGPDGKIVMGHPDLFDLHEWAPIEIKLTWASSRRAEDVEDEWFWRYWRQLQAYVKLIYETMGPPPNGQPWGRGFLVVIFINGNYRRDDPVGSQPQGYEWEEIWSEEEIEETWAMINAYAEEETV